VAALSESLRKKTAPEPDRPVAGVTPGPCLGTAPGGFHHERPGPPQPVMAAYAGRPVWEDPGAARGRLGRLPGGDVGLSCLWSWLVDGFDCGEKETAEFALASFPVFMGPSGQDQAGDPQDGGGGLPGRASNVDRPLRVFAGHGRAGRGRPG